MNAEWMTVLCHAFPSQFVRGSEKLQAVNPLRGLHTCAHIFVSKRKIKYKEENRRGIYVSPQGPPINHKHED